VIGFLILVVYEPDEGETGLSIKASSDAQFTMLTSSVEVSALCSL
jgi:hypothetical protein